MIGVLNRSVFIDQGDVAGELKRAGIAHQRLVRDFEQPGGALVFLPLGKPAVQCLGRGGVILRTSAFGFDLLGRIVHVRDERRTGFLAGSFWIFIDPRSG